MASETIAVRRQHEIWNELVGDAWVHHADLHDRQAARFGEAAMDAIGSVEGATALDVGCGTGAAAAALAERGAREVLGIDFSVPMVTAARARNRRPEVRFEIGDVGELEQPGRYDVIFSRFGVMFFADPTAAFGHLRRLGRTDARLGFCCWGSPMDNPWMTVPVMATVPLLGPPNLAGPGEPGPFSLASPDVILDVLDRAGWTDVVVQELSGVEPHPAGDAAAVARVVVAFSPPIAEGLRGHPERANEVQDAIAEALRPLERDGVVHFQTSALVVTAHAIP